MATYISIDPGHSVGVAVQKSSGEYLLVATYADDLFVAGFFNMLVHQVQPKAVIMERMPMGNRDQRSVTVSQHVISTCEWHKIPYVLVSPGIWKPMAPKQVANPLAIHMNDAIRLLYYVLSQNPDLLPKEEQE